MAKKHKKEVPSVSAKPCPLGWVQYQTVFEEDPESPFYIPTHLRRVFGPEFKKRDLDGYQR